MGLQEEESHSRRTRPRSLNSKQTSSKCHTDPKPKTAPDHGLATPHAIKRQCRSKVADDEHQLDASTQNLCHSGFEADVVDQDCWDVVHDEVWSDHLIHEQAEMSKQDTTACVKLVALEQRTVRLHGRFLCQSMPDRVYFVLDVFVGFWQVEHLAEDFYSFLVATVLEQPSGTVSRLDSGSNDENQRRPRLGCDT
jgi:hypothetical protein